MVNDEDRDLLAREMAGVKPLKQKKADLPTTRPTLPEFTLRRRRLEAATEVEEAADGLSDMHLVAIDPEEYIEFMRPGLQHSKLNKLRNGQLTVQYQLDLHGFTYEDARDMVVSFIRFCHKNHYSSVRIIHGKSRRNWREKSMKGYVNAWLKQIPEVLGFASCLPADGGTGAVYVLLSRPR